MKQNHWLLMATLVIAGCLGQMNRQYLSSISWLPIDSVFTYHVEKDGDHIFKSGDLLGLELIGGIEKKSHQFISVVQLDSTYVALVTKIATGLFSSVLDKNPLPASIELTVREDYCTIEALTQLKEKLDGQAPYIISEVALPSWIHPELRKVKTQDCIFRFKT